MIKIKRLQKGNEKLAREVAVKFWPKSELNDEFLKKETNYLLAAYVDNTLAGFAYAYELDRIEQSKPMVFLYSIDVLPEYQRRGIGKQLIEALRAEFTEEGFCKMFVLTDEGNTAAMRLYQSTGGKRVLPDNVLFVYNEEKE